MKWSEVDFQKAAWTIPQDRMKKRKQHHVPLSRQAIAMLEFQRMLTGNAPYVFPAATSAERPMSENTANVALKRLAMTARRLHMAFVPRPVRCYTGAGCGSQMQSSGRCLMSTRIRSERFTAGHRTGTSV